MKSFCVVNNLYQVVEPTVDSILEAVKENVEQSINQKKFIV